MSVDAVPGAVAEPTDPDDLADRTRTPPARRAIGTLVSGAAIVWIAVCGIGWLLTRPLTDAGFSRWEGGLDRSLVAHRTPFWDGMTEVWSLIGDTPSMIGISVLCFVALRPLTGRWLPSIALAVAMLGEVAIFTTMTVVIGRGRPTVPHLDGSPPTSSFPSGHAAASTTLFGVLVVIAVIYFARPLAHRAVAALAIVEVLAVGASRLYRGMHFPSDIVAGVLLGVLWVSVVTVALLLPARRPRR